MTLQLNEKFAGALGMLWIDLETTGTDEANDDIIEIGAILTDFNFERFDYRSTRDFSRVVEPSPLGLGRMIKNDVVREMHNKNGLLTDCLNLPTRARLIEHAEEELYKYMNLAINSKTRRGDASKYKFVLAGSGVGHFDRKFIDEHMPTISDLLSFKPYDVGQIRWALKLAGVEPSAAGNPAAKNHRALDDILLHLEEARAYRDMFKQAFSKDPAKQVSVAGSATGGNITTTN